MKRRIDCPTLPSPCLPDSPIPWGIGNVRLSLGILLALVVGLTLLGVACDDEIPGVVLQDDACEGAGCSVDGSGTDEIDARSDADDSGDSSVQPDDGAADAEDEEDLRGFGELCEFDSDCESGLCLIVDQQGLCTEYCSTMCPEGWACILYSNSGADAAHLCVPDNLCVDDDGDQFGVGPSCLGVDCDETDPEIHAGAAERCNWEDDDCDGQVDEGFDLDNNPLHCGECGRACERENEEMFCRGGQCESTGCLPGYWNVDGDASNGCEYLCTQRHR